MRSTFKILFYINKNKVKVDGAQQFYAESLLTENKLLLQRASIA